MLASDPESLLERAFSDALADSAESSAERSGEPSGDADDVAARLLDAAYEQFCRMGIRRTTMEDVARRAGVSRITAYRRFATKDTLVEQVIRREFRRYFDQYLVDIKQARTVADRVELGFVTSLQAIRRNPLIGGLIVAEPDLLIPSMISDGGRTMATVQRFLAGQLRREQHAGNLSDAVDVELVAEVMTRLSTSFLITPSHVVDLDDENQLRMIARRFLVPLLTQ